MLHDLLRAPAGTGNPPSDALAGQARQLRRAYLALDRRRAGADQVLELKFAALHWRHRLVSELAPALTARDTADHNTLTDIVDALGSSLPEPVLARLKRQRQDPLLALQGVPPRDPRYRALAGPGITVNIKANRSSAWPFRRWKRRTEFSRYAFEGDGVRYRGLHLRPGDVLLANVNLDGNGVYTTLSDPTRFASHAAVFAILEDDGRRYPAVIETFEKGVRAVPLNVFLGKRFSAYVEVYRHAGLDQSHASLVNRAALDMLDRARGYNFDSKSDDREYLSCCSVGRLLHMDAGLEPASWKSCIRHPRIRANLEALGYDFFEFFAPVDYALDPAFRCVGWVDNHQFMDLLARELVETRFRELFMTRRLDPERFPFMSRLNRWGIAHIRRQSPVGKAIGLVEGFDHLSLPKGPDPLMAVITIAEAQLGRLIRRTRKWLQGVEITDEYFSIHDFLRRPDVREYLEKNVRLPWLEDEWG
ncbi:MAG TPA: YiiX/YebB-like N1pC/P60 family cysteine hydrolase [Arenicellales bacterium]|nr:YiiX/YebB-like N1pC/P60 family cysteine hydrolase [Arenicellales bacterium]